MLRSDPLFATGTIYPASRLFTALHSRGKEPIDFQFWPWRKTTVRNKATGRLRQQFAAIGKGKRLVIAKKVVHYIDVFFRFERTGGVDQNPAGGEQAGSVLEQGQLFLPVRSDIFRPSVPADIGMSAGDSGAGAGGVDQYAGKEREVVPGQLLQIGLVDDRGTVRGKAGDIFPQFFQPVLFRLDRMDFQIMPTGQLEQVAGLAAEAGAAVEVAGSSPKGAKQTGGKLSGLVLHLEIASGITGQAGYRPLIAREHQRVVRILARLRCYLILVEELQEIRSGDSGGIGSYRKQRFAVIGPADPQSFLIAELIAPSGDKPFRMVDDGRARFVSIGLFGKCCFLPDRLAQDAVDETLQSLWHTGRLDAFDHFVDRGRWRDPFEEEQLIQSDYNRLVDDRIDFAERGPGEKLENPVQVLAVAKNTVHQLHGQVPLVVGQAISLHGPVEQGLDRHSATIEVAECFDGDKSCRSRWFFLQSR